MNRQKVAMAAGAAILAAGALIASHQGHHGAPPPAVAAKLPTNRPPASVTGALNPQVTQTNLSATICHKGWTTTIRPPKTYTEAIKRRQLREWKLPGKLGDYEEDHFIPLELGGSPQDLANLWPESHPRSVAMDGEENSLHRQVCANTLALADAQAKMAADKRSGG